ncbi:sensor domain-containing diguanylate cyclase [Oceanithermus desulfurans]|uniref:Diguanylate cyclase (GGDEF)-like protein n=1 Tax=Oceanithermus desulfurans TaxID=227924 RepID=A0ABR6P1Q8_9DEIN|nr:sensor domain-containing diguanylate cyclase [Oceanithermus desulfurans]MBB6029919.1 diguanylate cyclase (GGDEF)-like protein [Oceanithermus desulfurans]
MSLRNYRLLVQALEHLPSFERRDRLLRELPQLIASAGEGGDVAVWIPTATGFRLLHASRPMTLRRIPGTGVVGRAFASGKPLYVPDTRSDPYFIPEPSFAILSELALPLLELEHPVAVLNIDRDRPFHPSEREGLERFARAVSFMLSRLAFAEKDTLLAALSRIWYRHRRPGEAADQSLSLLRGRLRLEGAVLWRRAGRELRPLAQTGSEPLPVLVRRARTARGARPWFRAVERHRFALLPLEHVRARLGLWARGDLWAPGEEAALKAVAEYLDSALEAAFEREREARIQDLLLAAPQRPIDVLYQQVLAEAVVSVPGARSGRLWLREGDRFHVVAGDPADLYSVRGGVAAADAVWGQPKLFDRGASLILPVPYAGRLLALLELSGEFDAHALEAARHFVLPVATLLHEADTRRRLEEAALRDPLTGLWNRRSFDLRLEQAFATSRRYGEPFALALFDLVGFKQINDRLGHAHGDEALRRVAFALREQLREGDQAFRWGGDEFALILLRADTAAARQAALRHAEAVQELRVGDRPLAVSVGVASYPEDAGSTEALLRTADLRMYQAKKQGKTILPRGFLPPPTFPT